jgi:hypothetical protein
MVFDGFRPYGLKGAVADVKSELHHAYAAVFEGAKKLACEVESRGGSRHRATFASINGLVALAIVPLEIVPSAFDVRRERSAAHALENLVEISLVPELHRSLAELGDSGDARSQLAIAEDELGPHSQLLRGARQDPPAIFPLGLDQQELRRAAGLGSPVELGRKDSSVVDDQKIPFVQQSGQLLGPGVAYRPGADLQME